MKNTLRRLSFASLYYFPLNLKHPPFLTPSSRFSTSSSYPKAPLKTHISHPYLDNNPLLSFAPFFHNPFPYSANVQLEFERSQYITYHKHLQSSLLNSSQNRLTPLILSFNQRLKPAFNTIIRKSFKKYPPLLQILLKMDSFIILSTTLNQVCSHFYTDTSVSTIFISIGRIILKQVFYINYISDPELKSSYPSFNIYLNSIPLSDELYIDFGSKLCYMISHKTNLYTIKDRITYSSNTKKPFTNRSFIPNQKYLKHLEYFMINTHNLLPMIHPPIPWEYSYSNNGYQPHVYGGFATNNSYGFKDLVIKSSANIAYTKNIYSPDVIKCVNKLSSMPFTINIPVFKYILDHLSILNPYMSLHTLTPTLSSLNSSSDASIINIIKAHNSKHVLYKTILWFAQLYSLAHCFYFPISLDWRGRVYPNPTNFSYQSNQFMTGLILFYKGKVITDVGYTSLKLYTANCFGLTKKSIEEKISWFNNNLPSITNSNPDPQFIVKADKPILFLACCLEVQQYLLDPENFESRLPIFQDATASGLQHLTALTNSSKYAEHVNLYPNNSRTPGDIYTALIPDIKNNLKPYLSKNPQSNLSKITLNRNLVKKGIMTISYGVTIYGIYNKLIKDSFTLKDSGKTNIYALNSDNTLTFNSKDLYALATAIFQSVYYDDSPFSKLTNYITTIAKILAKINEPISWKTPAQTHIFQLYIKFTSLSFKTSIFGKQHQVTYKAPTNDINILKQANAIVPNLIHSLDSVHLYLIVRMFTLTSDGKYIITVHDSFATHASDAKDLYNVVVEQFIVLYTNNTILVDIHNNFLEIVNKANYSIVDNKILTIEGPLEIPTLPIFSSLDLNKIKASMFFLN